MYEKKKPLPGQLENCENCDKRFTVTAYSKTGPEGGLLCTKCSKEQEDQRKKDLRPKPKAANRAKQRQARSNLLDGIVRNGSKTLQELCVEVGDLRPSPYPGANVWNRKSQTILTMWKSLATCHQRFLTD